MQAVERLAQNINALSERDRAFASSLIMQHNAGRRALSSNQLFWVDKLAERATTPAPAPQEVGSVAGIVALFDRAASQGMRRAAILGMVGDTEIRLTVAGAQSRVPGSINVTDRGSFENRRWFGRITRDGRFEPSQRVEAPEGLLDGLRALASDPAGTARLYGRRTGNCCFCARELTDARSMTAGYGPICAERFALPWG